LRRNKNRKPPKIGGFFEPQKSQEFF